jgi:hypothetical protein
MASHKQCTKSVATHASYAGNRGKTALLHAIELLFFIKSAEFRKFHPSFLTPAPEEFLDFIHSRYRKHVAIPAMRHRPFHVAAPPKAPVLFKQFLAFMHPSAARGSVQSLFGCLFIVLEALSLYGVIKSAATMGHVAWRHTFCSATFLDEFVAPLYWLLEHKMPACFAYRQDIVSKMVYGLTKKASSLLAALPTATTLATPAPATMLESLGPQYIRAFQTVMMADEAYTVYFVAPLVVLFGMRGGVSACRDVCLSIAGAAAEGDMVST